MISVGARSSKKSPGTCLRSSPETVLLREEKGCPPRPNLGSLRYRIGGGGGDGALAKPGQFAPHAPSFRGNSLTTNPTKSAFCVIWWGGPYPRTISDKGRAGVQKLAPEHSPHQESSKESPPPPPPPPHHQASSLRKSPQFCCLHLLLFSFLGGRWGQH